MSANESKKKRTYNEDLRLQTYSEEITVKLFIAHAALKGKNRSAMLHTIVSEKFRAMPASEREYLLKIYETLSPDERKRPNQYRTNQDKK